MSKPFVFCHMLTSIDGKISGDYMETPEAKAASDYFYQLAFGKQAFYKNQGWLSGRKTTDDNFTFYKSPNLPTTFSNVPTGDYVIKTNEPIYYISIDPQGKLGWQQNTVQYRDTTATVIEILTEKASEAYKAFLYDLKIPFLICGKEKIDPKVTLNKLQAHFGLTHVMLGGGGLLNWSFIEAGVCDEVSLVIVPVADGNSSEPSIFETGYLSNKKLVAFTLKQVKNQANGTLWLRYKVKS